MYLALDMFLDSAGAMVGLTSNGKFTQETRMRMQIERRVVAPPFHVLSYRACRAIPPGREL